MMIGAMWRTSSGRMMYGSVQRHCRLSCALMPARGPAKGMRSEDVRSTTSGSREAIASEERTYGIGATCKRSAQDEGMPSS